MFWKSLCRPGLQLTEISSVSGSPVLGVKAFSFNWWRWGVALIKCLPIMHEAQSLIPSTRKVNESMNQWMNSSVESVIFQLLSQHLWLWLPYGAAYRRMWNVVCSIQSHILLWWQPHFSAFPPGRWCSFLVMTSPQSPFSSLVHVSFLSPDWL